MKSICNKEKQPSIFKERKSLGCVYLHIAGWIYFTFCLMIRVECMHSMHAVPIPFWEARAIYLPQKFKTINIQMVCILNFIRTHIISREWINPAKFIWNYISQAYHKLHEKEVSSVSNICIWLSYALFCTNKLCTLRILIVLNGNFIESNRLTF